jgi:hypothetical protein
MSQVVCANLGPRQARKRLTFGVAMFVVAVAAFGGLMVLRAPWLGRVGLLLPLWLASLGYFQARERT